MMCTKEDLKPGSDFLGDMIMDNKFYLTLDDSSYAEDKVVTFCAQVRSQHLDLLEPDCSRGEVWSDSICMAQAIYIRRNKLI